MDFPPMGPPAMIDEDCLGVGEIAFIGRAGGFMNRDRDGLASKGGAERKIVGGQRPIFHAPADLRVFVLNKPADFRQAIPAPFERHGEFHFVEQGGANRWIDSMAPVDPFRAQVPFHRARRRLHNRHGRAYRLVRGVQAFDRAGVVLYRKSAGTPSASSGRAQTAAAIFRPVSTVCPLGLTNCGAPTSGTRT